MVFVFGTVKLPARGPDEGWREMAHGVVRRLVRVPVEGGRCGGARSEPTLKVRVDGAIRVLQFLDRPARHVLDDRA
jgi:hypothetical protein